MNVLKTLIAAVFALSAVFLSSQQVLAQQGDVYTPSFGDLVVEGEPVVGSTVVLSGGGFAPDAIVSVVIVDNATGVVAHEEQTAAAADGSVRFELVIDIGLAPGRYTVALRGPVIDGATLDLAGALVVAEEIAPTTTTTLPPSTLTVPDADESAGQGGAVTGEATADPADATESADADASDESVASAEAQQGLVPSADGGSSSGGGALSWAAAAVAALAGVVLLWRYNRKLRLG